MHIAETALTDVRSWLLRTVEHTVRVRVASGALCEGYLAKYKMRKTATFRAGIPHDSRIFISEAGGWMQLHLDDEPEVVTPHVAGDPMPWMHRIFTTCGGRPVVMKVFLGECGLAEFPLRGILKGLAVPTFGVHLTSTYDDIHVRSMMAAELDTFLERTMRSMDRHFALTSGSYPMHDSWDVLMKTRERFSNGMATPGCALMTICAGSATIGRMRVEVDGEDARAWSLYIYKGCRGYGHSKATLPAMARGLKREGIYRLNIMAIVSNTGAVDIYESVGFRVTTRHVVLEPPILTGLTELQPMALAQAMAASYRLDLRPCDLVEPRAQALNWVTASISRRV